MLMLVFHLFNYLFVRCMCATIPRYCTCDTDCGPEPESPTFVPMIWGYHVGHHHNVEDDDEANKELSVTNLNISFFFFVRRTILGTMTSPTRLPRSKKHFNPDVRPSAKYQTKLKTQIPHNPWLQRAKPFRPVRHQSRDCCCGLD